MQGGGQVIILEEIPNVTVGHEIKEKHCVGVEEIDWNHLLGFCAEKSSLSTWKIYQNIAGEEQNIDGMKKSPWLTKEWDSMEYGRPCRNDD